MGRSERIPWPPDYVAEEVFKQITDHALYVVGGEDVAGWMPIFYTPLERELADLLKDCEYGDGTGATMGASYKQLALIGHMVGMDAEERRGWYCAAQEAGLTQRHVGHIIARIQDGTLYRVREDAASRERMGELIELAFSRDESDEARA